MQAVCVEAFGGVDVLQIVERQVPQPGHGEVLVRVAAAGLNYSDLMQREGVYPGGPKPPFFPGVEAAGIIEAVGPETSELTIGSRVACIAQQGAQAEFLLARCEACVVLPDLLSFPAGSAFLIQYLTAYHALITAGDIREGETLLVHAAAGGVGTAAVQIAKAFGLRVAGTASTAEKRERVRRLGADIAVGYDEFEAAIAEFTRGLGPQIILDTVGGEVTRRSLKILRPSGRLVLAGLSAREASPIDSLKLLFRSQTVIGFHLNRIFERRDLVKLSVSRLLEWIADGKVKIQVGHTFPLTGIRDANALMAGRASYGKLVLVPGRDSRAHQG